MASIRQQKAVDNLVESGGSNIGKAMVEAGYSEKTALNPKKLTESKGYKEILAEKGLTEGFVAQALVEDIKSKPGDRASEMGIAAKCLGMDKKTVELTGKDGEAFTIKIEGLDNKEY